MPNLGKRIVQMDRLTSEEEDDECQLNTENCIRKAYTLRESATNNVTVSQGFISSSLYNESSGWAEDMWP